MKIYTASKFSLVIVPPTLSEKTKESKLLVRSFRHIYKVAGLGIATGLSGLFSLSQFQNKTVFVDNSADNFSPIEESAKTIQLIPSEESIRSLPASAPMFAESESQDITQHSLDVTETMANSEIFASSDLFLPFVMITLFLGGITVYYLWKLRKSN